MFYETDRALGEYLLFHYGRPDQVLPHAFGPREALEFPVRCVRDCVDPAPLSASSRALDLGWAVGRASFELARHCGAVLGVDYSQRFIQTGNPFQWISQARQFLHWHLQIGDLIESRTQGGQVLYRLFQ